MYGRPTPLQLDERRRVGDRIRFLRRQRGLSQEKLAELIGRDRQSVSSWERGATPLNLDDITAIAHVFGIATWRLFYG